MMKLIRRLRNKYIGEKLLGYVGRSGIEILFTTYDDLEWIEKTLGFKRRPDLDCRVKTK